MTNAAAHSGEKSFLLDGNAGWVRADGIDVATAQAASLSYELSVMIPSSSATGAEIGFFVVTNPGESWDFNSFHFVFNHDIGVRGTGTQLGDPETMTTLAQEWVYDQWYTCRADIDFNAGTVDFWLDGESVATDIPAAPRDKSTVFSLGTYYGAGGIAYFDDISYTVVSNPVACRGQTATIVGTEGADSLEGTVGRDVIAGLGGDDVITGLGGSDRICGGSGNDVILGGGGGDRLFGDDGDDILDGAGGDDVLQGGSGSDTLLPGPGADTVNGGPGGDTVDYARAPLPVTVDVMTTTATADGIDLLAWVENVTGSRYADTIRGSRLANSLQGLAGDDVLEGRGGDDYLDGGTGTDTAWGGFGADTCYAESPRGCEWPINWKLWPYGLGPTRFGDSEASVRAALSAVFGSPDEEWGWPCLAHSVGWEQHGAYVEVQFLGGVFVAYGFTTYASEPGALSLATPAGIRVGSTGAEVTAAYQGATLYHNAEIGWKYQHSTYAFWLDWIAEFDPLGASVLWITVGDFCIPI